MEINNPQTFDHIIDINGRVLQPVIIAYDDVDIEKVHPDTIIWRKVTADEYHIPVALIDTSGRTLDMVIRVPGTLPPAAIENMAGYIADRQTGQYFLPEALLAANGVVMRVKCMELGVWVMNVPDAKIVEHGLDYTKIRSVTVLIRNDVDDKLYDLTGPNYAADTQQQGGTVDIRETQIFLVRLTGGVYDATAFDDNIMNRGFITIWYQD